jgi:hypothetical protein
MRRPCMCPPPQRWPLRAAVMPVPLAFARRICAAALLDALSPRVPLHAASARAHACIASISFPPPQRGLFFVFYRYIDSESALSHTVSL